MSLTISHDEISMSCTTLNTKMLDYDYRSVEWSFDGMHSGVEKCLIVGYSCSTRRTEEIPFMLV